MTKTEIFDAVKAAHAAQFTPAPASGCGRAYVVLACGAAERRAVATACKALGLMYLPKAYGTAGAAIYMGYDNADGRALGKARAFAAALKDRGIACYDDAVGD